MEGAGGCAQVRASMKDQERLRLEYARRAQDPRYQEWYAATNAANHFIEQDRDAAIRALLMAHPPIWTEGRILDIGCGAGHELAKWRARVSETRLCGIDLLPERAARGREIYPLLPLLNGDAAGLPLAPGKFDLVMQFTVLSSILDKELRKAIAGEMLRVLKPDGMILWYDYWFNPTNPQTLGIGKGEIQSLFPECSMVSRRVTLAPPLARWLAPRSLSLCRLLNRVALLRSHYLVLLARQRGAWNT